MYLLMYYLKPQILWSINLDLELSGDGAFFSGQESCLLQSSTVYRSFCKTSWRTRPI